MDEAQDTIRQYDRIGGWLIPVAIGVVISPLSILVFTARDVLPAFSAEVWSILTTPGGEVYHPLWAPLLIFELIGNTVFFVFSIIVAIFFFQKRRFFPILMTIFLLTNLIFVAADYFLGNSIPFVAAQEDAESIRTLVRAFIAPLIWGPYFLTSKRVKGTFLR